MKRFIAASFIALLLLSAVLGMNLFLFVSVPAANPARVVSIEKGTPFAQIIRDLESSGVVSNAMLFKAYVLYKKASHRIRAGEYRFPERVTPRQVLVLLEKGDFTTHRITIVEGWTSRDIAAYLAEQKLVDRTNFLNKCADRTFIQSLGLEAPHLEGYLFPNTYQIYRPKDEEEVIRKFVDQFKSAFTPELASRAKEMGLTQQETVVLASIVEKEAAQDAERPLIASVFHNRLKKDMPLASDPTIIYGIPNFSGNLRKQDLITPGPYNSYLNKGLPPTAISNPGLASLRAVLYPTVTNYLYFVSKNDGTHHFSMMEAEHAAAVRQYQTRPAKKPPETLPETKPHSL